MNDIALFRSIAWTINFQYSNAFSFLAAWALEISECASKSSKFLEESAQFKLKTKNCSNTLTKVIRPNIHRVKKISTFGENDSGIGMRSPLAFFNNEMFNAKNSQKIIWIGFSWSTISMRCHSVHHTIRLVCYFKWQSLVLARYKWTRSLQLTTQSRPHQSTDFLFSNIR